MILCDVFDIVCFVDNNMVVVRQHAVVVFFQDQVAKQDRVVGDDDVSGIEPAPRLPIKALAEELALSSLAVSMLASYRVPDIAIGNTIQIA